MLLLRGDAVVDDPPAPVPGPNPRMELPGEVLPVCLHAGSDALAEEGVDPELSDDVLLDREVLGVGGRSDEVVPADVVVPTADPFQDRSCYGSRSRPAGIDAVGRKGR